MNTTDLLTKFARIGARMKVADEHPRRRFWAPKSISLDIQKDREGEFFLVVGPSEGGQEVAVLDVQPSDRHLLLLVREGDEKQKYLCGHDERHWFVAAIPESAPVGTVRQAKEALKPPEIVAAQGRERLRGKARNRRKNAAYRRQGEWFFLPKPDLHIDESLILRDEPLSRGDGGKPHWAQFCYRSGGESVHVCSRYPSGVTGKEYKRILASDPKASSWGWRIMTRNASVFVRGEVRHPDHRKVVLHCWHQVVMNTENKAKARRHVVFLD